MEKLKETSDSDKLNNSLDNDLPSTEEKTSLDELLPILNMKLNYTHTMSEVIIRKSNFIRVYAKDVNLDYNLTDKLGQGAFGTVYKATNKNTGDVRAIKQIERSKIFNFERFINEVNSLAWLDHPNIVKMYEVYQNPK